MVETATTVDTVIEGKDNISEATTTGIEQKPFIVGEHSVYNTVEDLFKGAVQKEQYIQQLIKETAELRAQLEQNKNETNLLQELKNYRKETLMTDNVNVENTNTLTDDTIKEIALKALQENMAKEKAAANLQACKSMLGSSEDDINLALTNKAAELGVTKEDLEDMASTKPQLFKRLFDFKEPAETTGYIPSTVRQINTTPVSNGYEEFIKNARDSHYVASIAKKALENPELVMDWEWKVK